MILKELYPISAPQIPIFECRRVFPNPFFKQFIEIGKAFKTNSITRFRDRFVLKQHCFGLVNPVLVDKICKRHFGLFLEVSAKSSCVQMNPLGNLVHVGLGLVAFVDVIVDLCHTDFVVVKKSDAGVRIIQHGYLVRMRKHIKDGNQF